MSFYDEIIELLPSADLKAKIEATCHSFSQEEQLQIIYRYAPTYDKRLQMLKKFADTAEPRFSAWATEYTEYEQRKMNRFITHDEGCVYELCIKETPDSYEEKYLCSSYESALVCIDRFYKEYADIGAKETEQSRYIITKRSIFFEKNAFKEDFRAEILLGAGKTVLRVSDSDELPDCEGSAECCECEKICPYRQGEVLFPCFAYDKTVIKYSDYDLQEHFGIGLCCSEECNGFATELYVIPLDSENVRKHCFEYAFYDHEHVELPYVTLAALDDLDEITRKNCCDFIDHLNSLK